MKGKDSQVSILIYERIQIANNDDTDNDDEYDDEDDHDDHIS